MHTQTVAAADWWARSRGAVSEEWIANYQNSLQAPHRTVIAEIVTGLAPASLLEVGCHCGPNLLRLARALPEASFSGVDANAEAIAAGQAWVERAGLQDRVELHAGRFPAATSQVPDRAVEVVLSCYALAYIAPRDLDAALYEIGRLASRAVVLAEPVRETGPAVETRYLSGYLEWAHAYTEAIRWIGSLRNVTVRTVPVVPAADRLNGVVVIERCS